MKRQKESLIACRLLLRLATLAIFSCAVVPHARAQALEKVAPNTPVIAFVPKPSPVRHLPRPNFQPGSVADSSPCPQRMTRGQRRAWLLLLVAQHGAAFFDSRTTRDAVSHHQELDPLLRPFAHSVALYPVMQIAPVGFDWLAVHLATSRHPWLRRLWWVPQTAATVGFVWAGVHNLGMPTALGMSGP